MLIIIILLIIIRQIIKIVFFLVGSGMGGGGLQERPYPYKEMVTQFIKIGFYTFYNSFSMACAAQPRNKTCLRMLSKLQAFAP